MFLFINLFIISFLQSTLFTGPYISPIMYLCIGLWLQPLTHTLSIIIILGKADSLLQANYLSSGVQRMNSGELVWHVTKDKSSRMYRSSKWIVKKSHNSISKLTSRQSVDTTCKSLSWMKFRERAALTQFSMISDFV